MPAVGIKELLEAGVHYGHQTRRWNPKMRRFIHGEAGGIYLIDIIKSAEALGRAQEFLGDIAARGGIVLFVGTKKQARDAIKDVAERAGMPYVNHRWLGGLLTNFQTINMRIRRLHRLEELQAGGQLGLLPTRERMKAEKDLTKLTANLGGVKHMQRPPDAIVMVDVNVEEIAVKEANRLHIPIVALVDTNCDPDPIQFVIPGNDDAIRSCKLILNAIGDVVADRSTAFRAAEEKARAVAEEARKQEAAAKAAKDAEDKARREAAGEAEPKEEVPEATWKGEAPKEEPEVPRRGPGGRPGRGGPGGPGPKKDGSPAAPPADQAAANAQAASAEPAPVEAAPAETQSAQAAPADAASVEAPAADAEPKAEPAEASAETEAPVADEAPAAEKTPAKAPAEAAETAGEEKK